ncbi:MAG: hypothetical protein HFG65_10715 [Hungatella sp.]|nr:hypothetical protein [Hungatella sp.]
MEFFASAIETLNVLVIALGAGLGVWGVINLLEGYGNDNPGANAAGSLWNIRNVLKSWGKTVTAIPRPIWKQRLCG